MVWAYVISAFLVGVLVAILFATFCYKFRRFANRISWGSTEAPWLADDRKMRNSLQWSLMCELVERMQAPKSKGRVRRGASAFVAVLLGIMAWMLLSVMRWIAEKNQLNQEQHFAPIQVATESNEDYQFDLKLEASVQ